MAVLYEQDFSEVANGTNLTDVTPTVGAALVKHPDVSGNLVAQGGVLIPSAESLYMLDESPDDENVAIDALLNVTSADPDIFVPCHLRTQINPASGQAGTGYSGLAPYFERRAGIYNNSNTDNTGDEIEWPNGEDVWVRQEQQGNWLRLFVGGCEAMRRYVDTPLTSYRAGVGVANGNPSDNFANYKHIRISAGQSTRPQVTCFGDSLTRGQSGPQGGEFFLPFLQTMPTILSGLFGSGATVDVVNMGRPGATIGVIAADAFATSQTGLSPDNFRFGGRETYRPGATNIAVVWPGTNDVVLTGYGTPKTADQIAEEGEDFVADLVSDGFTPIVLGLLHSEHPVYGNPHTPTYNATVDDINARWAANFPRFINLAAMTGFQNPNDTDRFSDKLHLTAAAYADVADLVFAVANPLVNPPTYTLGNGIGGGMIRSGR